MAMHSPPTSAYLSTGLAQYEIQGRHPNPLSWNESQIQRLLLKTLPESTVILGILTHSIFLGPCNIRSPDRHTPPLTCLEIGMDIQVVPMVILYRCRFLVVDNEP